MRTNSKYQRFIKAIDKYQEKFKEYSDIPEEALSDKSIPTFGFKNGEKQIQVNDELSLTFFFKNNRLAKKWHYKGKTMVSAPAIVKQSFPSEEKEISETFKRINSVYKVLKSRVETYWLFDRKWTASEWKQHIQGHPLLQPWINGLIWRDETSGINFMLYNNEFLLANGKQYTLNDDHEISLWHPIIAEGSETDIWQKYIITNKITQPLRQAFREHYPYSNTELVMQESPRFSHHFLVVKKLMAIANAVGWTFSYAHQEASWPRRYIKRLDITVHLKCDYNNYDYAVPSKSFFFTKGNSMKLYNLKQFELLNFEKIPLRTLSELCRDVDLFIATSSIANDPELSIKSENQKVYRNDFHKVNFQIMLLPKFENKYYRISSRF